VSDWRARAGLWVAASLCLVLSLLVFDDRLARALSAVAYVALMGWLLWLSRPGRRSP
jgi:hypothetical protein